MYCFASDKNDSTSLDEMRHMIALQISLKSKRQILYGNVADITLFELFFTQTFVFISHFRSLTKENTY